MEESRKALEKLSRSSSAKASQSKKKSNKLKIATKSIFKRSNKVSVSTQFKTKNSYCENEVPSNYLTSLESSFRERIKDPTESFLTFGTSSRNSPSNKDFRIKIPNSQPKSTKENIDPNYMKSELIMSDDKSPILHISRKNLNQESDTFNMNNASQFILKENENLRSEIRTIKQSQKNEFDAQRIKFEAEINKAYQQIKELQSLVLKKCENLADSKIINSAIDTKNSTQLCEDCSLMTQSLLENQKSEMKAHFKSKTDSIRISLAESHEKEYSELREQFVKRISSNEVRIKQRLTDKLTGEFQHKIKTLSEEYESKLKLSKNQNERLRLENYDLRREVEILDRDIDAQTTFGIEIGASECSSANLTMDSDKLYAELVSTNVRLKKENVSLQTVLKSRN